MATRSDEATKLYIEKNMTISQIAADLGVSETTIYRYKAEADSAGDSWDKSREVYHMTPSQLIDLYTITLKQTLLEVSKNRELLLKPATADAITKSISNLQKLNPKSQMIGIIIDFIKISDEYLGTQNPDLQKKLRGHWESIKNLLVEKASKPGVFS